MKSSNVPSCFEEKTKADAELERVVSNKVVSVEDFCKASERKTRARRLCEIYFKPAEADRHA